MTFRDDHDAALARAEALEDELARAKAERDRAAAETEKLRTERDELAKDRDELRDELAKAKPKPAPKPKRELPDAEKRKKLMAIAAWTAGAIAIVGFVVFATCSMQKKEAAHDAWRDRVKAAQKYKERWQALIRLEPCVRWTMASEAGVVAHRHPSKFDPMRDRDAGYGVGGLATNCLDGAKTIAADPATKQHLRDPLNAWLAVEAELAAPASPFKRLDAYESNADWREDKGAARPQLWADVMTVLEKRHAAIAVVRQRVLPELRAELREIQKRHEAKAGRDDTWYRVELGLALWDINDISYEKAGIYAGQWFDVAAAVPAIRDRVKALVETGKQAPIEVRRELRKIEWITTPIALGRLPGGETPLWHLAHSEADLLQDLYHDKVPAIPDPGPEPERPGD